MNNRILKLSLLPAVLVLGACATVPSGPGIMALPGTGKSFDEFRANDAECRQYAQSQLGTTANDASVNNGVGSAAIGAGVGALAGALIGGGQGAGVGAGTGLIVGATAGSGTGAQTGRSMQQRYDFSYQQCMYARGNKIPVYGRFEGQPTAARPGYGPPPNYQAPPPNYPPPPPNYAPPPPPQGYAVPPQGGSGGYYPPPPPQGQPPR